MSHTMKVWERIIEARLRDRVEISKHQYGFMPGKGITEFFFCFYAFFLSSCLVLGIFLKIFYTRISIFSLGDATMQAVTFASVVY